MKRSHRKKPGEILGFNLVISIKVATLAFILSVAAIAAFMSQAIDREALKFIVTTIAASAGVTSAFYVGEGIRQNLDSKKVDRALAYISTWTSPQFALVRKSARIIRQLIEGKQIHEQPAIIKAELDSNHDLGQDIVTILNFLEEIAIAVENDLVDENIMHDYFKAIVKRMCHVFALWIQEQQDQRGKELYSALMALHNRWDKKIN